MNVHITHHPHGQLKLLLHWLLFSFVEVMKISNFTICKGMRCLTLSFTTPQMFDHISRHDASMGISMSPSFLARTKAGNHITRALMP